MKQIEKIINRNALSLHKTKSTNYLVEFYKKTAKTRQDLKLKIKTELDFFNAAILYESLNNKLKFEETYERERKELIDLWPTLNYQERNKLINLKLDETKKRCRYFLDKSGNKIWIAFFDNLLNALYDKEMNVFDLDQYFHLYKDFKQRMIPTTAYGIAPFVGEFIDITVIETNLNRVVFHFEPLKKIYVLTDTKGILKLQSLALRHDYKLNVEDYEQISAIMNTFEHQKSEQLVDLLLDAQFITSKVRQLLIKARKKQT